MLQTNLFTFAEPGTFEFSKSSMLIQAGPGATGALSVVRSGGSDGRISVPWIVQPAGGAPVPTGNKCCSHHSFQK